MIRFLGDNIWDDIGRLAKRSGRKYAAVAYVTTGATLQFGKGDLLIVDASDHAIKTGQTSAPVLGKAFRAGAEIYSNRNLHAKLFLFDRIAVIGSGNVSEFSRLYLFEAAIMTDHPAVVSPARAYVEDLKHQSKRVNARFIARILSIKVVRPWRRLFFPPKRVKPPIRPTRHRTWLIGVKELDENRYRDEQRFVNRGEQAAEKRKARKSNTVGWLRWTGRTRFRRLAHEGDSVIQIWRPLNAKKPSEVYKYCPILLKQDNPKWTRFYIEEPPNAEKDALPWTVFKGLAKQVGISQRIGPTTERLMTEEQSNSLDALWKSARR